MAESDAQLHYWAIRSCVNHTQESAVLLLPFRLVVASASPCVITAPCVSPVCLSCPLNSDSILYNLDPFQFDNSFHRRWKLNKPGGGGGGGVAGGGGGGGGARKSTTGGWRGSTQL